MNDDTDSPDLVDVLRAALAAGLGRVRVAIPAKVVSYDAAKQTITAQVVIRSRYLDADGAEVAYLPAPVANVPVDFPSGGGYAITWPLNAGDPVVLVVCDRSVDEWKTTAQGDNTPAVPRRFDLTDAIAIPGGRSPASPLGATSVGDAMVVTLPTSKSLLVGADTATDGVARSSITDADLNALKDAFDAWTPALHDGGTALKTILTALLLSGWPTATGSTRLKTDG